METTFITTVSASLNSDEFLVFDETSEVEFSKKKTSLKCCNHAF